MSRPKIKTPSDRPPRDRINQYQARGVILLSWGRPFTIQDADYLRGLMGIEDPVPDQPTPRPRRRTR